MARDVYHCHPDELTLRQERYLREFVALALLEAEEIREASRQ